MIFHDERDQLEFLDRLTSIAESGALAVFAWALMPNHFHLLCRTGAEPLSRSMSSLLTGYAVVFNRRHRRVGHLFQNRFHSILCEEDGYFRELIRYIHLNPIRAGMVSGVDELERFRWTGHAAIVGAAPPRMIDVPAVLSAFGSSEEDGRESYRRFVVAGLAPEALEANRDGKFWERLASVARQDRAPSREDRVLGSGRFLREIRSEVGAVPPRPAERPMDLDSLVAVVTASCDAPRAALAAGSKLPSCARAREGISYLWLEAIGGSCHELVAAVGVTEPSIYRAASRGRLSRDRWNGLLRAFAAR